MVERINCVYYSRFHDRYVNPFGREPEINNRSPFREVSRVYSVPARVLQVLTIVFNLVYEFYARRTPLCCMCSLVNQPSRHSLSRVTCTRKGCARTASLQPLPIPPSGGAMCKLHYRNFPSVREGCSKYFTIDRPKEEKPADVSPSVGRARQIEADVACLLALR